MKFSLVCEDSDGNLWIREVKDPAVEVIKELGASEKIAQFIKWERNSVRSQYVRPTQPLTDDALLNGIGFNNSRC